MFSSIFVADLKIMFGYNPLAPLKHLKQTPLKLLYCDKTVLKYDGKTAIICNRYNLYCSKC